MKEVLDFLQECRTFYLATSDNGKPRCRPFGFAMEFEGKIYFCTANNKNVYRQMKECPNIEISTMNQKGTWLRLCGEAVFDANAAAKKRVFEVSQQVAGIYQSPDNPIFEVFYIKNAEATFYSFTEAPKVVKF